MTTINPQITIVSGLPRCGTSMMMQMLEAGGARILTDHVRESDEDNPKGYYEYEAVKQTKQDPSWVRSAGGMAVKMVYRLLYDLPPSYQYRVIFMKRPLDEVIASQRVMLQRTGQQGAALSDKKLADVFTRELTRIDQWLHDQGHMSVLDVSYHDVLEEPLKQVEAINRFLDGGLDTTAMANAVEPTLHRQKG